MIGALITLAGARPEPAARDDMTAAEQRADALRRHGGDPGAPLASRVGPTPKAVLRMFDELGGDPPTPHDLTEAERRELTAAFEALPPLHRRVLRERLRTVSFLDGMPNTALTSTVDPDGPYPLFDITIRAGILDEDVSEWLTWKERTCFEAGGSTRSVTVEAGGLDALLYVLLHEATHVVDSSLGFTPSTAPDAAPAAEVPADAFISGVWTDRTTPSPCYRDPLLEGIRYRAGGSLLPIDRAEDLYGALRRTPFASLYGSSNWHDDLAEAVAHYHLTEALGQPYRIIVRDGDAEVFSYEPMTSDLVRSRFSLLAPFYEGSG
jgi:hypothetical protein